MKHLCGTTTHFTFFAVSHKQTAHDSNIFLPFVTLSPSTSCGSDLLPSAVCASHTRFHPAFLVCSKAQTSLPASLPQQPSRTGGVLREQRGGTGGDPSGLSRPLAPACGHQLPPACPFRARGRMPSLSQWE